MHKLIMLISSSPTTSFVRKILTLIFFIYHILFTGIIYNYSNLIPFFPLSCALKFTTNILELSNPFRSLQNRFIILLIIMSTNFSI